ncbi:MAG: SpoIVB peptidase [Clostridia bacterium]
MLKAKRIGLFFSTAIISFVLLIVFFVPLSEVFSSFENLPISKEDISIINENKAFGNFVTTSLKQKEVEVGGVRTPVTELWFKLFGIIPIKKTKVLLTEGDEVYLGGNTLGFALLTNGVIVVGENKVETESGVVSPQSNGTLQSGDVIKKINDTNIANVTDISEFLKKLEKDSVVNENTKLKIFGTRKGSPFEANVNVVKEKATNKLKLGIWARDDASGIGTLTYVKQDGRFGALGHPITDFETGAVCDANGGTVHKCAIVGINKGKNGKPGELQGLFLQDEDGVGTLDKNTQVGVFGNITEEIGVIDVNKTAKTASRLSVVPGKAKIISNISGIREEYDIEIIKATKQNVPKNKGMVFRVIDKRLISLTGGVVQGMSGSPIVQNGKIVGAVTHVFVSDPTKGYGIYLDWMIDN